MKNIFTICIIINYLFNYTTGARAEPIPRSLLEQLEEAADGDVIYAKKTKHKEDFLRLTKLGTVRGKGLALRGSCGPDHYNQLGFKPRKDDSFKQPREVKRIVLSGLKQCLFLDDELPNICISDNAVHVWGAGQNGSLGNKKRSGAIGRPEIILHSDENEKFIFLAGGTRTAAVVTDRGRLFTWGQSSWGSGHAKDQLFPKIPNGARNLDVRFAFFYGGFSKDSLVVITRNGDIWRGNDTPIWEKISFNDFIAWYKKPSIDMKKSEAGGRTNEIGVKGFSEILMRFALNNPPKEIQSAADEKTLEDEETTRSCKICFEIEPNCLFLPCLHLGVCQSCARELKACPFCRVPIQDRKIVFFQ